MAFYSAKHLSCLKTIKTDLYLGNLKLQRGRYRYWLESYEDSCDGLNYRIIAQELVRGNWETIYKVYCK